MVLKVWLVPRTAAAASLGNFLWNLGSHPYPRITDSETLEWDPAVCVLTSPPGNSNAHEIVRLPVFDHPKGSAWLQNHKSLSWLQKASRTLDLLPIIQHFILLHSPLLL